MIAAQPTGLARPFPEGRPEVPWRFRRGNTSPQDRNDVCFEGQNYRLRDFSEGQNYCPGHDSFGSRKLEGPESLHFLDGSVFVELLPDQIALVYEYQQVQAYSHENLVVGKGLGFVLDPNDFPALPIRGGVDCIHDPPAVEGCSSCIDWCEPVGVSD